MQRPRTVAAIAVIDFAGSTLLLLPVVITALIVAAGGEAGPPVTPGKIWGGIVFVGMEATPIAWGIVTGIALLRMRLWALASTLVFAGFLVACGACSGAAALLLFIPATGRAADAGNRLQAAVTGLGLAGLGIWWLIYCSRRRVRAQFVARGGWARRPFSMSLAGWLALFGGCLGLFLGLLSSPWIPFWPASSGTSRAIDLVGGLVALVAGVGLLRLHAWARTLALAFFALVIANSVAFWTLPGAMQADLAATAAGLVPAPVWLSLNLSFLLLGSVASAASGLVVLYYLWTRRAAFYPPAPAAAEG